MKSQGIVIVPAGNPKMCSHRRGTVVVINKSTQDGYKSCFPFVKLDAPIIIYSTDVCKGVHREQVFMLHRENSWCKSRSGFIHDGVECRKVTGFHEAKFESEILGQGIQTFKSKPGQENVCTSNFHWSSGEGILDCSMGFHATGAGNS